MSIRFITFVLFMYLLLAIYGCQSEEKVDTDGSPLPRLHIDLEGAIDDIERDQYMDAEISLEGTSDYNISKVAARIRGRGNSTWGAPKKPYQIRFDEKMPVLGMLEDRRWVLLAHHADKSLLRNELTFELAKLSRFDWSPQGEFVDVYIDDEYRGTYQLCHKVEATANRVALGDTGFLLEIDQLDRLNSDDVYFETNTYLYNIKDPDLQFGDARYQAVEAFVNEVESTLLGPDVLHPTEGYKKYVDVSSFVDYYLINEITRNTDAKFYSSTFLTYVPGQPLKLGPIWDFDLSLGNVDYNDNYLIEGFYMKDAPFFAPLFDDPSFVQEIKDQFEVFYEEKESIKEHIVQKSEILSRTKNFEQWETLGEYVWPNHVYFDTYEEEVAYMIDWFDKRMEWLKVEIANL